MSWMVVSPDKRTAIVGYRTTPISTRANVAFFGTFGYELDLNKLTEAERALVREQIAFMKQYRAVIQFGTFYRLLSPFDGGNIMSWMVVSPDKRTAIVGLQVPQ